MRKLLGAFGISVLAMSYLAAPEAVGGAITGTVGFGVTILQSLSAVVGGSGGGAAPPAGGQIVTGPNGEQIWLPPGATLETP